MATPAEKATLLDLLLGATSDGIVDWDLASDRTSYNERWRYLLGWDDGGFDLTATTWRELIHEDERPAVEQAIADHLDQGWPLQQTVRMRHRTSGWRWIMLRGMAQRSPQGDAVRMILIFTDVDERVRAEAEIRALVETIPDSIIRLRSDGTVLAIKEGDKLRTVGLLGGRLFDSIRASDAGNIVMERVRDAASRTGPVSIPCRLQNPGAEVADYDIRVVSSGPDEAVCIVRDVTREKLAEDHLARKSKLEAVGQLASGLAHEINTPLQYIGDNLAFAKQSVIDLLELIDAYRGLIARRDRIAPSDLAAIEEKEQSVDVPFLHQSLASALDSSAEGLAKIAKIVGAIKTFQEVGRQEREPVMLNTIVENAVVVATHSWADIAEVSMVLAPDLPPVPCIAGEVAQAVVNLILNAAQAIRDKVGASGSKGRITLQTLCCPEADVVEIRIADDGIGIAESIRGRIFDPFFTTRPPSQGGGHGLTQVHAAVVRLHQGTVHFDSREGKGTTFVVRLPLR